MQEYHAAEKSDQTVPAAGIQGTCKWQMSMTLALPSKQSKMS